MLPQVAPQNVDDPSKRGRTSKQRDVQCGDVPLLGSSTSPHEVLVDDSDFFLQEYDFAAPIRGGAELVRLANCGVVCSLAGARTIRCCSTGGAAALGQPPISAVPLPPNSPAAHRPPTTAVPCGGGVVARHLTTMSVRPR